MAMTRGPVSIRECRVSLLRGGAGSAVLLLHGAGGSTSLTPLAESLAAQHEVMLPDHPGFGESDGPDWLTSMSDLAYFYLDLLRELDLREVHIVGHSMGGWLASEMAIRSTARVRSLTLVSAVGIYLKGVPYGDMFLWSPEQLVRNLYATDKALGTALAHQPSEREIEIMVRNRVAAARYGWNPRLHNPDLAKWLHRIDVPTLVLWGAEDRVAPVQYGREFARLIPNAQLTVFPQCGHLPQLDQTDSFVAALGQFFRKVEA